MYRHGNNVLGAIAGVLFASTLGFAGTASSESASQRDLAERGRGSNESPAAVGIVEFEGGVVGNNMAQVIAEFSKVRGGLPTREYVTTDRDKNICDVLERELKIKKQFCTANLLSSISRLNGGKRSILNVRAGQRLILPAIKAETFEFQRTFNLKQRAEAARSKTIDKNRAWQSILTKKNFMALGDEKCKTCGAIESSVFEGYRWTFPIEGEKAADSIELKALKLDDRNTSIEIERPERVKKFVPKRYTVTPNEYYNRCSYGSLQINDQGEYERYLQSDYKVQYPSRCRRDDRFGTPVVFLLDTPVQPHPDISHALPESYVEEAGGEGSRETAQACMTNEFNKPEHHGTYLSSIIASKDNEFGFKGLFDRAQIRPFHWVKGTSEDRLHRFLRKNHDVLKSQVFLLASEFRHYRDLPGIFGIMGHHSRRLANKKVRLKKRLNRYLAFKKILFIVAAGHDPDGGIELRPISPMSPQNMGDYQNVVVVTACAVCDGPTVSLWDKANRSSPDQKLVHLAAPGGAIPGLITKDRIGMPEFGGTSSAAAFVAGIAARMLDCYPNNYVARPERVKERLVLTSRFNLRKEEAAKVLGGVVDAELALLDPDSSWLKVNGGDLKKVELVHWCSPASLVSLGDDTDEVNPDQDIYFPYINRLTDVGEGNYIGISTYQGEGDERPILSSKKYGPVFNSSNRKIAHVKFGETSCAVKLSKIQDLVLNERVRKVRACQSIRACDE